jgi:uncharacterized protein (TIGR03067 family)
VTASAVLALTSLADRTLAAVPESLQTTTVETAVATARGQSIASVASVRVVALAEAVITLLGASRWKSWSGQLLCLVACGLALACALALVPPSGQESQSKASTARRSPEEKSIKLREMLQLKGTWESPQTDNTVINGVPQPPRPYKLICSIDRDTITMSNPDGFVWLTFKHSLELEQSPKQINLKSLNHGFVLHGIYKLEGDTLTICDGLNRPKEFREGSAQVLTVFHRESRTPVNLVPEVANAPGCYWAHEPSGVPSSMASGPINM